jgi:hypothetical protein
MPRRRGRPRTDRSARRQASRDPRRPRRASPNVTPHSGAPEGAEGRERALEVDPVTRLEKPVWSALLRRRDRRAVRPGRPATRPGRHGLGRRPRAVSATLARHSGRDTWRRRHPQFRPSASPRTPATTPRSMRTSSITGRRPAAGSPRLVALVVRAAVYAAMSRLNAAATEPGRSIHGAWPAPSTTSSHPPGIACAVRPPARS